MPYPLPPGDAYTDTLRWFLVAVPDKPEYVRAALGAYTEFTKWYIWERDEAKRGADAADAWDEAVAATLETLEMGFPDILLGHIDEVEALLTAIRNLSGCCGDQDPTGGDFYTDRVEDGVGDVPQNVIDAGYATGVSDWDGFADYKCMIAHALLDTAKWRLQELVDLVDTDANDIVGGIGAVTAVLGFIIAVATTGPVGLAAGIIAAAGAAAKIYEEILERGVAVTTQVIADLETFRDEIVCSIVQADGDEAALSAFYAAVDDNVGLDGTALIAPLNLGPALKALYAGRYDQTDVAQKLADLGFVTSSYTCSCDVIPDIEHTFTFPSGSEGWTLDRVVTEGQALRFNATGGLHSQAHILRDSFINAVGSNPTDHGILEFSFDLLDSAEFPGGVNSPYTFRAIVFYEDGTNDQTDFTAPLAGTHTATITTGKAVRTQFNNFFLQVTHLSGGDNTNKSLRLDNVYVALEDLT